MIFVRRLSSVTKKMHRRNNYRHIRGRKLSLHLLLTDPLNQRKNEHSTVFQWRVKKDVDELSNIEFIFIFFLVYSDKLSFIVWSIFLSIGYCQRFSMFICFFNDSFNLIIDRYLCLCNSMRVNVAENFSNSGNVLKRLSEWVQWKRSREYWWTSHLIGQFVN